MNREEGGREAAMQNSLHFTRNEDRNSKFIGFLTVILGLILIDQITKTVAFSVAPAARLAMMQQPDWTFGFAWHIHEPNAFPVLSALFAFALVGIACTLPVSNSIKVLWAAAAVSNHVEMLARPGTVDFLALKVGNTVWVG